MKRTLLDMVQTILSDMDSDEVNSIDDTVESEQVSKIVKDSFFDIIDRRNWPHLNQLIQLNSSGTTALPTHLYLPERVKKLNFIQYNVMEQGETQRKYQPIKFLYPDEFLQRTNARNNDNDDTNLVVDPTGVELLIRNDLRPTWWTSFDDEAIVFDAYMSDVDSTLQTSKTQCQAYMSPDWQMVDDFVPDLPADVFTQLLEESKSAAFLALKQMVNEKAESRAKKHNKWNSRQAWHAQGGVRYANFGRRGRMTNRNLRPQPLAKDD